MNEHKRKRLINFKVSDHEYDQIELLARRHSTGNISEWLRNRGMTVEGLCPKDVDEENDDDNL